MPDPLSITEQFVLAENDGWRWCVGKLGNRWLGYAREGTHSEFSRRAFANEGLEVQPSMLMLFHQVADGCELGVLDRERAVKLVTALAADPESDYGDVLHWFVPVEERGDPEALRCKRCGDVGCDGTQCVRDAWDDYRDAWDDYGEEFADA